MCEFVFWTVSRLLLLARVWQTSVKAWLHNHPQLKSPPISSFNLNFLTALTERLFHLQINMYSCRIYYQTWVSAHRYTSQRCKNYRMNLNSCDTWQHFRPPCYLESTGIASLKKKSVWGELSHKFPGKEIWFLASQKSINLVFGDHWFSSVPGTAPSASLALLGRWGKAKFEGFCYEVIMTDQGILRLAMFFTSQQEMFLMCFDVWT